MAQNEAVFAIRITDGGTLQIVQKNAKKAAAGLDDLGAAVDRAAEGQNNFNRGQKGVIGATSNSTKSFSKMRDAIGGSSGLVGAYATLAANIFALSAAFNALNRSFQAEQLAKSIEILSASSGTNLARISKNLVEVTGSAISMADAMRAASFGTSAGFNSTQLETLAKVAKGASIALGRDLNDSFDRLTRGAAKLEPEILDELGIIVRIDKAVADYAARVGKGVKELSLWERQQAFVNAINEQGIKKYGQLADAIETSPYDRIISSLTNASNATLKWLNDSLRLPDFLNYLSESTTALTGAIALFASTITKQMLPEVYKIPQAFAAIAVSASNVKLQSLTQTLSSLNLKDFSKSGQAALKDFSNAIADATLDASKMQGVIVGLDKSYSNLERRIKGQNTSINNNRVAHDALQKELLKEGADTAKLTAEIAELNAEYAKLNATLAGTQQKLRATGAARTEAEGVGTAIKGSESKQQLSTGIAALGAMNLFGLKDIFKGVMGGLEEIRMGAAGAFGAVGKFARGAGLIIGTAFSASLAAVLGFMSLLSLVALLFPNLQEKAVKWWKSFTGGAETAYKALEETDKKTEELAEHLKKVNQSIVIDIEANTVDGTIAAITRLSNVLMEIGAVIGNTYKDIVEENRKLFDEAGRADQLAEQLSKKRELRVLEKEAQKKGVTEQQLGQPVTPTYVSIPTAAGVMVQRVTSETDTLIERIQKLRGEIGTIGEEVAATSIEESLKSITELPTVLEQRLAKVRSAIDAGNIYKDITDPKVREAALAELQLTLDTLQDKIAENKTTIKIQTEIYGPDSLGLLGVLQPTTDALNTLANDAFTKVASAPQEFVSRVKELPEAASKVSQALDVAADKSKGKFGELVALLDTYNGKLQNSSDLSVQLNRVLGEKAGSELAAALKTNNVEGIINSIRAAAEAEANIPGLEKQLQVARTISGLVPLSTQASLEVEQLSLKLTNEKIALEEASIAILKQQGDNQTAIAGKEATIKGLKLESLDATVKTLDPIKQLVIENDKQLQIAQQLNELKLDNLKIEQRLQTFSKTGRLEATYQQTKKTITEEFKLKKEALTRENSLTLFNLELEKYKIQLFVEQLRLKGVNNELLLNEVETILKGFDTQIEQAKALNAEKAKGLDLAEKETGVRAAIEASGKITTPTTATALPTGTDTFDAQKVASTALEGGQAAFDAAKAQGLSDGLAKIKGGLVAANTAAQPFLNSLRALGPQGEVTAAVAQGALVIANSWSQAAETIKGSGKAMEKGAAIAQAAGATIGAINQMLQANSNARISAIDSEIAAEQKRDGKSKESLAKIESLEKKKEQEKRKAFEMNKKMMMAQTVANTAAAIMQALAQGGLYAIPIAAMFGALGAAQLAIIASTSYQGGGASTAAGAPSSIAVGQRTSSIDLAKSKSSSGELAYMRGEQGMGGPEAFTPAFTGMKYRAAGGATAGFMVGEQGPELFIPDRPGTIVPADQTANMGGVTNVSFSISAIDTQGVEDMLENQKGAIINMIRSAANSYGQPFIEQVDTSVYRPAPKSRTYRR